MENGEVGQDMSHVTEPVDLVLKCAGVCAITLNQNTMVFIVQDLITNSFQDVTLTRVQVRTIFIIILLLQLSHKYTKKYTQFGRRHMRYFAKI